MTPEEVETAYQRLRKYRARLERLDNDSESVAAARAEDWQALLDANEKHVTIAQASGVHKTYIKKELERRAAKKAG